MKKILFFLLLPAFAYAQQSKEVNDRIKKVENSLAPSVVYGDTIPKWNIEERMKHAGARGLTIAVIRNYKIEGVITTLPFGLFVLEHEAFLSGKFDTQFVEKYYTASKLAGNQKQNAELAAIVALRYWLNKQKEIKPVESVPTNWRIR